MVVSEQNLRFDMISGFVKSQGQGFSKQIAYDCALIRHCQQMVPPSNNVHSNNLGRRDRMAAPGVGLDNPSRHRDARVSIH